MNRFGMSVMRNVLRGSPVVVALVGVLVMSSCLVQPSPSADDELRRTTMEFFERSAEFWNDDTGPDSFESVAELSRWHEGNERQVAELRDSFVAWSTLLERENAPDLLLEARDGFGVLMDDFKEQVDITRSCIDQWGPNLELVGVCWAALIGARLEEWEHNYRASYDAWERWRASGDRPTAAA